MPSSLMMSSKTYIPVAVTDSPHTPTPYSKVAPMPMDETDQEVTNLEANRARGSSESSNNPAERMDGGQREGICSRRESGTSTKTENNELAKALIVGGGRSGGQGHQETETDAIPLEMNHSTNLQVDFQFAARGVNENPCEGAAENLNDAGIGCDDICNGALAQVKTRTDVTIEIQDIESSSPTGPAEQAAQLSSSVLENVLNTQDPALVFETVSTIETVFVP
jgi:hypothetical protein